MMYSVDSSRMRVFLDANILFSATDTRSRISVFFLELLRLGHEAVTSSYAWAETQRNLERKRPHWLNGLDRIRNHIEISDASIKPVGVACVEKDEPILAGAIGARCTHLWTGDKAHFGAFYGRKICGVTVISSFHLATLLVRDSNHSR
jgi:predicted nucleic acid-binding protein